MMYDSVLQLGKMTKGRAWLHFVPKYDWSVAPSVVVSSKLQYSDKLVSDTLSKYGGGCGVMA